MTDDRCNTLGSRRNNDARRERLLLLGAPVLMALVALGAAGVVAGGWLGTRALLSRPPLASLRALG